MEQWKRNSWLRGCRRRGTFGAVEATRFAEEVQRLEGWKRNGLLRGFRKR